MAEADIKIIMEVLGNESVVKAGRVTERLTNDIKALGRQLQKGTITNRDYQRGVQQLIKKNSQHAGGYTTLQKEVQRYSGALQRQVNNTKRAAAAQNIVQKELNQTTVATTNAAAEAQRLANAQRMSGKSTNKFGMVAQQVGYQVGDFFVQVQSGTNAMMAFGQQGTQLAGLMPGLAGAVVGIGLSAFTMLAGGMMRASDAAKQFNNVLSETEQALSTVESVVDIYEQGLVGLRDRYGEVNAELLEHIQLLKEVRLQEALNAQAASIEELFNSLDSLLGNVQSSLKSAFDTTNDSARNLEYMLGQIGKQTTFEDQKRAVIAAREEVQRLISGMEEVSPTAEVILKNLVEMEDQLRVMVKEAPESSWMNNAITGVNGLINRIIEGINKIRTLKGESEDRSFAERYEAGEFPGTPNVSGFRSAEYFNLLDRQSMAAGTSGGSSGGGGGMSATEKQEQELRKAKDAVDALRASYDEAYATELKVAEAKEKVNKLIELNPKLTDEANQVLQDYIASLNEAENPMQKIADTMRDSLGDAFMSIVDGSKSAGEAFKDMARLVLKQAFELLVIKPILDGLFGEKGSSGGGLLGKAASALFSANGNAFEQGGKLTAYANGGVVTAPTGFAHSGGLGVMGEAGPEAIMPLKRGKNGKLGVESSGGQQPVVINQSFNFQANGDDSVKRIIAQEAPKIAQLTQKQVLDQRARGGAFRTTFGG